MNPMKEISTRSLKNHYIPKTHPSQRPSLNHYFYMSKVSLSIIQCHFLDHLFWLFQSHSRSTFRVEQSPILENYLHLSKMTRSSRVDQLIIDHLTMTEHLFIFLSYVLHFGSATSSSRNHL